MNNPFIRELLDKYFRGETTLEEEKTLREFFSRDVADPDLKPYQELFSFFQIEQLQQPSEGLEERFFEQLSKRETSEPKRPEAILRTLRPWLVRAAMVAFLLIGSWWIYTRNEMNPATETAAIDWSKYEPETPEEALRITKEALGKASRHLNKGTSMAMEEMNLMGEMGKVLH
ncbi:MAG: hypothetical protein IPH16_05865 [Haliscomenobacter sp.]|nr:hypothetical protein [Haliscomenobacter sp.]MBK7475533.1 hypothetical protein [Haliscomenobacter sp.]